MPARDSRYALVGHNSAGDPMYARTYPNAEPADGGYSDMLKADLEAELEARGLPKSGNKDELIARLEEDDG